MLIRALIALEAYQAARRQGLPQSTAHLAAVAAVRNELPGAPISLAEVRRIKAEFMPERLEVALQVEGRSARFGAREKSRRGARKRIDGIF